MSQNPASAIVFLVFLGTCLGIENIPKIIVYPCNVPVANSRLTICCRTENLYDSPIYFFRNVQTNVIGTSSEYSRNKTSSSDISVFKWTSGVAVSDPVGLWGCGYYGGISTYNITVDRVVTTDSGYTFVNIGSDAILTWNVNAPDVNIFDPNGQPVEQTAWEYNKSKNHVKLTIRNISSEQNGTYICRSDKNRTRDALTVVVMYPPSAPTIIALNTTFSGSLMTVTFACHTTSPSAAPRFYTPQFNISWIYSKSTGYTTSDDGSYLTIKGFNCDVKKSRPIFCSIMEANGKWSPTSYNYPHHLCSLKPLPVAPTPDCWTNKQQKETGTIVGIVFGVLTGVFLILWVVYRCCKRYDCDDLEDCWEECGDTCTSFKDSCLSTCCARCKKDDEMTEPFSFHIPRTREEDELERVLNLYNIPDRPATSNHEVIEPTQGPSVTQTSTTEENITQGAMAFNFVNGTESAKSVQEERCTLVGDLERCLKDLSKLVDRRENQVTVRRNHLVDDVLNIYADQEILRYHLHVKLLGESGSDWGGVSRDVFTTFWNTVIDTHFQGQYVHVPHLSLVNMGNENQFINLGRILTHSTAILGFLPVQLSKCSLMVMIYNTTEVDESALLHDFLLYLDGKDSKLLKDALENFTELTNEQISEIQDLFIRFDMGCVLKQESFKDSLLKVARNELCIKPRYLWEKIRQGIPEDHFDMFWCRLTVDHIDLLHARLRPTAEKVLRVIAPTIPFGSLSRRRRKVYEFFQEFIGNLNGDDLQNILQLITGQSCVPKKNITVDFSDLRGVQRRPLFHTCSYMVELPDSYSNYRDFEREMKTVMQCEQSKEFTMA